MTRHRHPVGPDPRQLHCHMQGCRPGRKSYRILAADLLTGQPFRFVDICSHRAHPVGLKGLFHVDQLFPVHGGGAEPYLVLKGLKLLSSGFLIVHPDTSCSISFTSRLISSLFRILINNKTDLLHFCTLVCFIWYSIYFRSCRVDIPLLSCLTP